MDEIIQIYFDFAEKSKRVHVDLLALVKSMLTHGYNLEECLDMTQFHMTYNEIFLTIPKEMAMLKFILWILPKVRTDEVIHCLEQASEFNVEFWQPILVQKKEDLPIFSHRFHNMIRRFLQDEQYEMLDLFNQLGVDFTRSFEHMEYFGFNVVSKLERLLKYGADSGIFVGLDRSTILYKHVGDLEIVQLLLDHGADPNRGSIKLKASPLFKAMCFKYVDSISLLMAQPNIDLIGKFGKTEETLLHLCIWPEFWPQLIEAGNDINTLDKNGKPPIYSLVKEQVSLDVLEEFLELKPELEIKTYRSKKTVFFLACERGWLDTAKLLLRYGADPNTVRDSDGMAPKDLLSTDHPRYNELFNHNSVKRAE